MVRRTPQMDSTQSSQPQQASPEEQPLSLVGPPAKVPQPQPVELVIGDVPTSGIQEQQGRPQVTVDKDGITTIN